MGQPKRGPSSRRTGNLAHRCRETGEYRAMRNGPYTPFTGPPKMSESWLIRREAAQYLGKMKEKTAREKRGPMNSVNYLPHWRRSRTSLGKGRPTRSFPKIHTQSYGNLEDLPNLQH